MVNMPGFGAAVLTSLMWWHLATRSIAERRVRKFAGLNCKVVGLMGCSVLSVGVLPSMNGLGLGPQEALRMSLE